ncbi:MAG: hypothetical protein ACO1NM_04620 [Sphingobium phenoxybenzoativorans]
MRLKPDDKIPEISSPAMRHWLIAAAIIVIVFLLGPVAVGILRN